MSQKGENKNFTGFVAIYKNNKKIYEKENFYSKKLKKFLATNWLEVDKEKLEILQLYWKGQKKAEITKKPSDLHKNELKAEDWFFSQKGYFDINENKIKIISRNIGFKENNLLHIISVQEETGEVIFNVRILSN